MTDDATLLSMKPFLPRRRLLSALRVLIALLLFGQFTLLAQACTAPSVAVTMIQPDSTHGAMPCCKHMSANACLSQLTQADEVSAATTAALPAILPISVIYVVAQKAMHLSPAPPGYAAVDFPEPPPAIRFCSFQT